jgi:hypothetical protein
VNLLHERERERERREKRERERERERASEVTIQRLLFRIMWARKEIDTL